MIINLFTNENEQNNENKVLDNLLVNKILVVLEASMHVLLLTVEWWPFSLRLAQKFLVTCFVHALT